ncbi:LicD family protein [Oribacterium sp. oral taxon 102]|uniref:LicD family protein n=1 Tax=Oribacterium sp. oral taxon 102 TaxID=671214 RepID=UPI0015C18607|nr:LicD family protein [Oribacterium sp. oral taxon 102]NWO20403.1 LicD family protein [Oribacterium sp. oral taxon 102]
MGEKCKEQSGCRPLEPESFDLDKVHEASLDILREIDRICRKRGIAYRIDSGTLLGAVRHKGFIPWDDDVDLVFRREEFERFRQAAQEELSDRFELVLPDEYRDGAAFYDFVPRVIYRNSRRHSGDDRMQAFYEGKLNHLWVDLFILDRLPAGKLASRLCRMRQQIAFGLGMGHRRCLDFSKYCGIERIEVGVLSGIGRLLPMPVIFRLQERWARKYTDRTARTGKCSGRSFFSNYQPDFQYCVVEDSWEEPYTEYSFEGERFLGPRDWDRVLHMLYGEYMQLPPEEKRLPSHSGREIEVLDKG